MSLSALRAAAHVAGMLDLANIEQMPASDGSASERVAAYKAEHPELFLADVRSMSGKDFKAAVATMLANGSKLASASAAEHEARQIQQREQQRQARAEIDRAAREARRARQAEIDRLNAEMRGARHARSA